VEEPSRVNSDVRRIADLSKGSNHCGFLAAAVQGTGSARHDVSMAHLLPLRAREALFQGLALEIAEQKVLRYLRFRRPLPLMRKQ